MLVLVQGVGMARIVLLLIAAVATAACGIAPAGSSPGPKAGTAVDPGVRPDAATCQTTIRSDIAGALAVRAVLSRADFGHLPIATDEATARSAAADPTSDLGVFGIPVTKAELDATRASGVDLDYMLPLTARMEADTDAYGNHWEEGGDVVVAVTSRDAAVALRCFEPADRHVRYVACALSKAAFDALQNRINDDWQSGRLKVDGIDVRMTAQTVRNDVFVIQVTVHALTPVTADELRSRYGDTVVLVEGEGPTPA
jgi:hypothetical protein